MKELESIKVDIESRFDINTNFREYGLPMPEILSQDVLRPSLRRSEAFDAIVCDPPYGLRARSNRKEQHSDLIQQDFCVNEIY